MNSSETKALIDKYNIKPARTLGQNFLIDGRVVYGICEAADLDKNDMVIEIGPGLGALTSVAAKFAGQVTAIEIDHRMISVLDDVLSEYDNTRIITQDALKADYQQIAAGWHGKVKVAANLPYYITTEIVVKLITCLPVAENMILMMQKEAAERIFALPGSKMYGPASVLAHLYGSISRIMSVPPSAYFPRPHVASVVIRLKRRDSVIVPGIAVCRTKEHDLKNLDWIEFNRFVEACFCQRRKTLANSLRQSGFSGFASECLDSCLQSFKLKSEVRAEQLEPIHFLELYYIYKQNKGCQD